MDKLYDNYFDDFINIFPSTNDELNIKKYSHLNHLLENSLSNQHISLQKEFYKKYIKIIKEKKSSINIYDKTILYDCTKSLKSLNYNFNFIPINHQENILLFIMELPSDQGTYPFSTKIDYINVVRKLENLECITTSIIYNMIKGTENKITLPKILAEKLLEQFIAFRKNESYKNNNIKVKLDFDFNKKCKDFILPCLNKIIEFLSKYYVKTCRKTIGFCCLPNGKEMYRFLVKDSLSLNYCNIQSIHNYGLKEVDRIYKEMLEIRDKKKFKGSLKEFCKYLKSLDEFKFKSKNDVIKTYKDEINKINKTIINDLFYKKVKNINCEVKAVPSYNEAFSSEAYYIPGDLNNTRKGTFYANMRDISENNKIEVESLTLHEANPGHHYQLTYVNESKKIPLFLKVSASDAYAEGWALYCESLGSYDNDESYFGKLILEMLRAVRLVVDTGIHYYKWSFNKTFNYSKKYSFDSDIQIKNQIYRYMAIPGQALSYKIGEKVILDLYKKSKKRNNFNIKDFHEKILEDGAIPLFLLKQKFD